MKTRSFQLKIVLVTLVLTGICLCAFGFLAWTLFYRMGLDRVDLEIKTWGQQHLSKYRLVREWRRFEQDMTLAFGQQRDREAVLLLGKNRQGNVIYQSDHWPSILSPSQFPTPADLNIPEPSFSVSPFAPTSTSSPSERRKRETPASSRSTAAAPPNQSPETNRPFSPDRADLSRPISAPPAPNWEEDKMPPEVWNPRNFIVAARFRTVTANGQTWRLGVMANEYATLVLAFNLDSLMAEMRRARLAFLVALPVALLLIAGAGWLVSRRALRPVRLVTETARRITAQGLDQRIPAQSEDYEFEELISVLNQMLDRLERNYQQAIRFSADAAHELKTPLTILQGELEQALRNAPSDPAARQEIFESLMNEVLRLKAIVQKLLLLSKADAGQLQIHAEPMNLAPLIEELADDAAILAPGLTIRQEAIPEAWVRADCDLIRQVLQNLASNAIKYTPGDGVVLLKLSRLNGRVQFLIANNGEPIPAGEAGRIFDRFYRCDKARGRRVDGVGLGLSLSREIAHAHGGELALAEPVEGMTAFTLTLPEAPANRLHSDCSD